MEKELTEIKGIGPSAVDKLKEFGILTIQDLANSQIQNLTKIKGIGATSAEKWIEDAKTYLSLKGKQNSENSEIKKSLNLKDSEIETKTQKPNDFSNTTKSPERFQDTAKMIPSFLNERLSKKAYKIMKMSYTSLKRESMKNLMKYQQILAPEKIKFNPSFKDEKNAILAIEEKSKFIETLILNDKQTHSEIFLRENILVPLKRGKFNEIFKNNGEKFNSEKSAIRIYDELSKKTKKSYPFTETACIREIQKLLEEYYPENNS
ncbi:MAG: helix-hairpin-helix domain-containing protein [Candidatus Lokiarchaeota archaeon]